MVEQSATIKRLEDPFEHGTALPEEHH